MDGGQRPEELRNMVEKDQLSSNRRTAVRSENGEPWARGRGVAGDCLQVWGLFGGDESVLELDRGADGRTSL